MAFFPVGKLEKLKNQIVIYSLLGEGQRVGGDTPIVCAFWGRKRRNTELNVSNGNFFTPPMGGGGQVFNSKVDLVQKYPSINLFITGKLCRIYMHPADRQVTTPRKITAQ